MSNKIVPLTYSKMHGLLKGFGAQIENKASDNRVAQKTSPFINPKERALETRRVGLNPFNEQSRMLFSTPSMKKQLDLMHKYMAVFRAQIQFILNMMQSLR